MKVQSSDSSEPKRKNHLAGQPGAYLEQHSTNLVDWYPWGPEALEKAKKENKPIFLSIGYASCHWCHVMEHESFADNTEVAEMLNSNFVSIKVDRELRPDMDSYYQEINSMFGKSGGWPLSIFLTPDLKPIFTGTYIPSKSKYGMPSFPTLLKIILETFQTKKDQIEEINRKIQELKEHKKRKAISIAKEIEKQKVEKQKQSSNKGGKEADENQGLFGDIDVNSFKDSVASGYDLETQLALAAQKENPLALTHKEFGKAFEEILNYFDQTDGGFAGSPKFAQFAIYDFLFNHYAKSEKDAEKLRHLIKKTLEIMAYRGLYDQVGGGFHRYSVDAQWIIPHFEKMLYDNAIALSIYSKAARLFRSEEFLAVALEVAEFLNRELKSSEFGFYKSGIDADAAGKEGRFHVWSTEELKEVLTPEEYDYMATNFLISDEGNFEEFNQLVWNDGKWAPTDPMWMKIKAKLRKVREQRVKPAIITNLLGSWNVLTGIGFLELYYTTNDRSYLKVAKELAKVFTTKLLRIEGTEIKQVFRIVDEKDGVPKFDGTLEDVAYAAKFFVILFELTAEDEYAKIASMLVRYGVSKFCDPESLEIYLNALSSSDLKVEARHADEPLPGPSFVLYEAAVRIQFIFKDAQIQTELERLRLFALYKKSDVFSNPAFYGAGLTASQWDFYGYQPLSVFSSKQGFFRLKKKVRELYIPYFQLKFSEQEGYALYGDGGATGDSNAKKQINYNLYINYCHDTLCSVILGSPKQAIARIQKEMKNVDSTSGFSGDLAFNSLI